MKKHLIAAAVAAAVAVPAMAQTVTLYGTLDGSVQSIRNGSATGTGTTSAYVDSTISSSVWGMRGSEDLGGGLKATFETQGDLSTNNGYTNTNGLFRRAANVGVGGGFGQVDLGLKMNPLIAANGALMPVGGNSISTTTAYSAGYTDFFTKNAVTYTSPNISGFVGQVQWGSGNNVVSSSGGGMTAASLTYINGPLELRAAAQDRSANGVSTQLSANGTSGDKSTSLIGAKYAIGNITLGIAQINNKYATSAIDTSITQYGVGYQASNELLIGGTYVRSDNGSNFSNLQARYSLSKRTTAYGIYGHSSNSSSGAVYFKPTFQGTAGNESVGQNTTATAGVAGVSSTAFGAGLIHTF